MKTCIDFIEKEYIENMSRLGREIKEKEKVQRKWMGIKPKMP